MIHITLPDGSVRTFEQEQITPLEVAKNISNGLAKKAIVAKVNGNLCSLGQPINEDASVSIYTFDDPEGRCSPSSGSTSSAKAGITATKKRICPTSPA